MNWRRQKRERSSQIIWATVFVITQFCNVMSHLEESTITKIQTFVFNDILTDLLSIYIYFAKLLNIKHAVSCVLKDFLTKRMHSHTNNICLAFHHCVFSNESSKYLHVRKHSHTNCIYLTFLHCVFSNVPSKSLP